MKLTLKDLAPLWLPGVAFICALVLGWWVVSYAPKDLRQEQQRLSAQTSELEEARLRFQRSDEEKATILKYLSPGRQLKEAGVPGRVLTLALIVGMILFFPLPVVGGPLGFVATIYLFERMRVGPQQAWPSTRAAIKAVLQSIGIEMGGAFLIAVVFFTSALLI